jgi:hypothetical protein
LKNGLSKQLAYILAAGGPREQLARVRWPMHVALREACDVAGRRGELDVLALPLSFRSSSEVGVEAVGADKALDELVRQGVLQPAGQLREAVLVLDPDAAVGLRRELMALPAGRVVLLQRAGMRWAALASTAAKNRSTPARSSGSRVSSSRPNRAKRSLPRSA